MSGKRLGLQRCQASSKTNWGTCRCKANIGCGRSSNSPKPSQPGALHAHKARLHLPCMLCGWPFRFPPARVADMHCAFAPHLCGLAAARLTRNQHHLCGGRCHGAAAELDDKLSRAALTARINFIAISHTAATAKACPGKAAGREPHLVAVQRLHNLLAVCSNGQRLPPRNEALQAGGRRYNSRAGGSAAAQQRSSSNLQQL